MIDGFDKLVKNCMIDKSLYQGVERATVKVNGSVFHGRILKFNSGDTYLFISNVENHHIFHGGYSVFNTFNFKNRCLWVDDEDIVSICGGMLV